MPRSVMARAGSRRKCVHGRVGRPWTRPRPSTGIRAWPTGCSHSGNTRVPSIGFPFPPPRSRRTAGPRRRRSNGRRAMAGRYAIRPAQAADVDDVGAIERAVFSDPWSAHDFGECVASGALFLVAEEHGTVVGYVVAHDAADEGEILNLGVAPAHRRRGLGRALIQGVVALLGKRGVRVVYLEVRESNAGARRLYQSLGFGEVARRARYYRRPVEDAVVLRAAIQADGVSAKL